MSTKKERLEKLFGLFDDLDETDIIASNLLSKISLKIAKYRLENRLTQKDFADFLDVSQSMVSKIESEDYNYTIKMLVRIFSKMKIKFDIVFSDESTYKEASSEEIKKGINEYDYSANGIESFKTFQKFEHNSWYLGDRHDQYTA